MGKRKTAIERVEEVREAHVVSPLPPGFPGWKDHDSMVVSSENEINGILRRVPKGYVVTLDDVRTHLARRYQADIACPVSTAIYSNTVAKAAVEREARGEDDITPFWRMLRPGGKLNEKFPGGIEAQKARLEAEGFTVVQQRKQCVVADYQNYQFKLDE